MNIMMLLTCDHSGSVSRVKSNNRFHSSSGRTQKHHVSITPYAEKADERESRSKVEIWKHGKCHKRWDSRSDPFPAGGRTVFWNCSEIILTSIYDYQSGPSVYEYLGPAPSQLALKDNMAYWATLPNEAWPTGI